MHTITYKTNTRDEPQTHTQNNQSHYHYHFRTREIYKSPPNTKTPFSFILFLGFLFVYGIRYLVHTITYKTNTREEPQTHTQNNQSHYHFRTRKIYKSPPNTKTPFSYISNTRPHFYTSALNI